MEDSPVAPHRGFNAKARDVLIGDNDRHLNGMPLKSSSDFDLRRRLKQCTLALKRTDSNNTNNTNEERGSPTKSQSSSQSVNEPPCFDSIGEKPVVKKHKQLSQIGKTRSCMEFKSTDKRLIRTYQEDNILKMPSMESDMDSLLATRSDFEEFSVDNLDVIAKASIYSVSDEQKKKDVKQWLEKSS